MLINYLTYMDAWPDLVSNCDTVAHNCCSQCENANHYTTVPDMLPPTMWIRLHCACPFNEGILLPPSNYRDILLL